MPIFEAMSVLTSGDRTGRIGVTKNGPELVAETTELGPNRHLIEVGERLMTQSIFTHRQTATGGA